MISKLHLTGSLLPLPHHNICNFAASSWMHGHFYILVEITEESCYLFISSNYKIVPLTCYKTLYEKKKMNEWKKKQMIITKIVNPWLKRQDLEFIIYSRKKKRPCVEHLLEKKKKRNERNKEQMVTTKIVTATMFCGCPLAMHQKENLKVTIQLKWFYPIWCLKELTKWMKRMVWTVE